MLSSLAFWKREPRPPPTFQPEDLLGLKTIQTLKLDEVVPTKNLHLVTRTSRLALTISMYPPTTMCRRGRYETNPNRWKKYPRDFPRLLTLLPAPTTSGRFHSSRAPWRTERTTTTDRRTVVREFGKGKHEYLQVSREKGRLKLQMVLVEMDSLFAAPPVLPMEKRTTTMKKKEEEEEEEEDVINVVDHGEPKKSKLSRKRSSSMSSLLSYALKAEEEEESINGVVKEDSKLVNGMEVEYLWRRNQRRVEEITEPWVVLTSSLPERPAATAAARNMLQQEGGFRFGGDPLQMVGMSRMRAVKT